MLYISSGLLNCTVGCFKLRYDQEAFGRTKPTDPRATNDQSSIFRGFGWCVFENLVYVFQSSDSSADCVGGGGGKEE